MALQMRSSFRNQGCRDRGWNVFGIDVDSDQLYYFAIWVILSTANVQPAMVVCFGELIFTMAKTLQNTILDIGILDVVCHACEMDAW